MRRHLQGFQAKGMAVGALHEDGGRALEGRQVQIDVGDGLAVGNDCQIPSGISLYPVALCGLILQCVLFCLIPITIS